MDAEPLFVEDINTKDLLNPNRGSVLTGSAPLHSRRASSCQARRLRDEELRLHERLLDRDERALLECFDRFGQVVYCLTLAETGDAILAEAVTERLFIDLWLRPQAFSPSRRPIGLQLVLAIADCVQNLREGP